jgi:hypothetical protein
VVDTDETATRIVGYLNREKLGACAAVTVSLGFENNFGTAAMFCAARSPVLIHRASPLTRARSFNPDKPTPLPLSAGRVTFMPLNRLSPPPVQYPTEYGSDAVPLTKFVKAAPAYAAAVAQVFGKTMVCRSLELATQARPGPLLRVPLRGRQRSSPPARLSQRAPPPARFPIAGTLFELDKPYPYSHL